ncbi:hypothetical protein RV15_GL003466 [Enterococcus silesiacus]|uniref:Uncharacterized protein n=1 Tax=Enterococcus silesiacus TaxID=332949 RepID=A0AA91GKW0_9ENTE|nr:hypothetical protein RV15_GL003466 [Enterococcus silesiacus]
MRLAYQILYKDSVKVGVGSLYDLYTSKGFQFVPARTSVKK